jgi:hypothetical protein
MVGHCGYRTASVKGKVEASHGGHGLVVGMVDEGRRADHID